MLIMTRFACLLLCLAPGVAHARGSTCYTRECQAAMATMLLLVWLMVPPALAYLMAWGDTRHKWDKQWIFPLLKGAAIGFFGWMALAWPTVPTLGSRYWWVVALAAPLVISPMIYGAVRLNAWRLNRRR